MIKQFNFYKAYADTIGNLTHAEAWQYIKKMLELMFRDNALDKLATDKVTSLLLLISEDLGEENYAKNRTTTRLWEQGNALHSVLFTQIFSCF